tara:strand:+ start:380 stop:550 length:171 start_codon:yes stop_codon:yes gene_type:complete
MIVTTINLKQRNHYTSLLRHAKMYQSAADSAVIPDKLFVTGSRDYGEMGDKSSAKP